MKRRRLAALVLVVVVVIVVVAIRIATAVAFEIVVAWMIPRTVALVVALVVYTAAAPS